jgi:hypothetical protein
MNTKPLDKRRKYYFVLDCETATMPHAHNYEGEVRRKIAIAKPLIYDLGWKIIDSKGKVYRRKSYLITEIFSVPSIFNTAYYASKRPHYIAKLKSKEIALVSWETATAEMIKDMEGAEAVGAYNSMFDYKKAIAFTEEYITYLYSDNYAEWEAKQNHRIDYIATHPQRESNKPFDPDHFTFRGKSYPLFDIWGLSCENLLDNDEYRKFCSDNNLITNSGKYYSTTAESTYKYITKNEQFVESHTAIEDADIECEILARIFTKVKPKNMTMGIIYFPFRILGRADTETLTEEAVE